jgi:hypothetical protein
LAPSETKETAPRVRVADIRPSATIGTFACTERKRRVVIVYLDQLAPYEGAAGDNWPEGGSSRHIWESNHCENRATVKKGETDHTSQAQPTDKKKWQYACKLFGMSSLKEDAV